MPAATEQVAVLDEEVWRTWLQKRKLREEATARKARMAGGVVLILLVFGCVFYRLVVM
jgi:hypothetical protein